MKGLWMTPSREEVPEELPPLKRKGRQLHSSAGKPSSPERGNDLWLLTLSDLLLLLMVFFVILFGLALQQKSASSDSPVLQAKAAVIPEEIPREKPVPSLEGADPPRGIDSLESALRSTLDDKDQEGQVMIARRADNLFLIFPETIVFDPGQAQLKPSARSILEKVASLASSHPHLLVEVQGHTDNKPIHNKRYASNWELSVDRATQVVKALIGLGLNPVQISGKGFGEYRALYPNDSDSNRHKNRRVEIQFSLAPSS
jgi:chemotaxis protein MotB